MKQLSDQATAWDVVEKLEEDIRLLKDQLQILRKYNLELNAKIIRLESEKIKQALAEIES